MVKDFIGILRFFLRPAVGGALLAVIFAWAEDFTLGETLWMVGVWLGFFVAAGLIGAVYKRYFHTAK